MKPSHTWKFSRVGGVEQVTFRNGADIAHIDQLDLKLWMALAMPTRGVEFDSATADLVDFDKDGRIRPVEVIAAVKWAETAFKELGDLIHGGDKVALHAIKDLHILSGAKRILVSLQKADAEFITLADVSETSRILAESRFNGDGVVIAELVDDPAVRKAIEDILATLGAVADRSGKPGVNQATLDSFFAEAEAFSKWAATGETDRDLTPIGLEGTAAAAAAVKAVKAKVDDYFGRCRLAAYDPSALAVLNRGENDYQAVTGKDLTISVQEIAEFPLAIVGAGKPLPLSGSVNPAWAEALNTLATVAITPLLGAGRNSLNEADWSALLAKLRPYDLWTESKPATAVEKLGVPRLRELIGSGVKSKITELIARDAALEGEFNQFAAVEKLVRFQKDLYELLTNFVNFSDFYGRNWAVFQVGTLYLDNRSCNLCIDVTDSAKHGSLAHLSGAFLAYCDLTRPGGLKRQMAAVFTDGSADRLIVGRNGVFYDRQGMDWDATVTKIVSNPISIREAFWSPYKKLVRIIEEQIAKRATNADALAQQKLATTIQASASPAKAPVEPPRKVDTGTLAAIGLVMATLLGALGTIFAAILKLPLWQIPLVMIGIVLCVSVPSMLMAYTKLIRRNLGPILDANGWAINNVAKMNIPFGKSLTELPRLPAGSERSLEDPFAEETNPWPAIIIVLAILAIVGGGWYTGTFDRILPAKLKSTEILGATIPTNQPSTNTITIALTNAPPATKAAP